MTYDWWAEQEILGAVVMSTDEGMKFAFVCAATEESPYWDSVTEEAAEATWDEWIARVRRDAAREALDELIAWHRANAQDTETPAPIRRGIAVMAGEAQRFRDTHYPETED